jgi:hypothetical protein
MFVDTGITIVLGHSVGAFRSIGECPCCAVELASFSRSQAAILEILRSTLSSLPAIEHHGHMFFKGCHDGIEHAKVACLPKHL